jgi:hypothetical protein
MNCEIAKKRKFVPCAAQGIFFGIICGALCSLTGCAGAPPQVITQTRTVEVPVSVPCKVPAIERPAWALDQVDPGSDIYTKGRAALVEVGQRMAYEVRLEAAVASCQ